MEKECKRCGVEMEPCKADPLCKRCSNVVSFDKEERIKMLSQQYENIQKQ